MAAWSADDIALARELLKLRKQSPTIKDFYGAVDAIKASDDASMHAQHEARRSKRFESSYKKLLLATNGDADRLARKLYRKLIDATDTRTDTVSPSTSKANGRPPNKWGRDGAGKIMFYFCIEEIMQEMRAEGISRPKVKDAVARSLGIVQQQRHRASNVAKINDHASRYSEARKILKPLLKRGAILEFSITQTERT